jgi:hypothetical protein
MTQQSSSVSIRMERDGDRPNVARLAALDSARMPAGPLLMAEVDGRAVAALSLTTDAAVADPFERTAEIVALLQLHASQTRMPARRVRDRLPLWERLWERARPGAVV